MKNNNFNVNVEVTELKTVYDSAQSFYKKAHLRKYYNNDNILIKIELISYNTIMLSYEDGVLKMNRQLYNYSNTTLRHIKEFFYQFKWMIESHYPELYKEDRITKKDIIKLIEA